LWSHFWEAELTTDFNLYTENIQMI
jgi:hypothetical protein